MKQVCQNLGSGVVSIEEVPVPTLKDNFVLVRNYSSVISAGTEKSKIDMGKKNLIQKAKARPDLVKKVLQKLKTDGITKTLQTVRTRLDAPSPLGYSSSGEVIAVGGNVKGILPGDRVACAGAGYANHAELIAVPRNLVTKIPPNISYESAAFTTVAAIALQGIRLAQPQMGERFLVIGLGLLGQIAVQLLRANGCEVIGTDLNSELIARAEGYGAIPASDAIENECIASNGGVDGVVICAGTSSNDPIELAGRVTREKGRVVVIGAVGMDIPREEYFKKEISLVISRSYGPGRYDPEYEEKGQDYPVGYVRFTENRNMETVLQLMANGNLNVGDLITHRFDIDVANNAYALIEGETKEPYLGVLLSYNGSSGILNDIPLASLPTKPRGKSQLSVSFLGAGNYATATLLPSMKTRLDIELFQVATSSGRTALGVAKKFGFQSVGKDLDDLLESGVDAVCITTRHGEHASATIKALEAGKDVYVEKPLSLNIDDLKKIHATYQANTNSSLMVGFNRRYSQATKLINNHLANKRGPRIINIRVNAGNIPQEHWVHCPEEGGGRLIGECCHFIDLAKCFANGSVQQIYAIPASTSNTPLISNDNVSIGLKFQCGSIANIIYTSSGTSTVPKEHIEVFCEGSTAIIDDFKSVRLHSEGKRMLTKSFSKQDKGQKAMINTWVKNLKNGKQHLEYESILETSLAAILAVEAMMIGQVIEFDLAEILKET